MDFGKILISSILVIVYFYLFGYESIERLLKKEMTIAHSEEEPQEIKAPGMSNKGLYARELNKPHPLTNTLISIQTPGKLL